MAYYSLQAPTSHSSVRETRKSHTVRSQRKQQQQSDASSQPEAQMRWVDQAQDLCSSPMSPTSPLSPSSHDQVLPFQTARLESFFSLDAHVLGSGQFGTVRRCTERLTGARFACKTITKDRLTSEAEREEVRREVALMQRVGASGAGEAQGVAHPGVVQLRGVFEDEQSVHLVMDLCEGGELFDEVVRRGRLSEPDAANVFAQVASAVAHCHARGVLHRDLKPENILLTRDASAPLSTAPLTTKLADFGLAVPLQSGDRAMGVAGSPFYMAPEVLLGEYALEADVWSLGVILYILLCGAPPFWGPTDKDVFVEVLKGVVDFSGEEWAGVSEEAKRIVLCLLQRDPKRRPAAVKILSHPWILQHCHASVAGVEAPAAMVV
ncbi:unnamed protein product [Closterium sp. Naga37s-1]|nr:unnamed protein product [Closterium sp. Naga37s-1]CAI5511637.1 unnamed protein product [Closterium sp. Naga37s-1]